MDDQLRELERRVTQGDSEAEVPLLRLRLRSKLVDRGLISARAYAGLHDARVALDWGCPKEDKCGILPPLARCRSCRAEEDDDEWISSLPNVLSYVKLAPREVACRDCKGSRKQWVHDGEKAVPAPGYACFTCKGKGKVVRVPEPQWLFAVVMLAVAQAAHEKRCDYWTCPEFECPHSEVLNLVEEWVRCPGDVHAGRVMNLVNGLGGLPTWILACSRLAVAGALSSRAVADAMKVEFPLGLAAALRRGVGVREIVLKALEGVE